MARAQAPPAPPSPIGGYAGRAARAPATPRLHRLTDGIETLQESELPEGTPVHARADGIDLVVVRRGEEVFALSDRCTHRGGTLHEGELDGEHITCPLHGSRVCLRDGAVARGPASAPEPAYETRVRDGRLEVRLLEVHRQRAA